MKRGLDQEEPSMTFHTGKAKLIWKEVKEEEEDEQHEKKEAERRRDLPTVFGGGGGMDELLAVLGYKVRSSEMADVAEKLEQLEMVMGSAAQEDGASNLYNDTVHYNPSDLSSWVENMLSEFNDPLITQSQTGVRNSVYEDDSEYDLRAIPGIAANYPSPPRPPQNSSENQPSKRFKSSTEFSPPKALVPPYSEPSRSVVVIDTQEAGVRLVHTLMACAEAVQQDNLKLADALIKQIGLLASSQAGAMRKVATYFAEALARRVYRIFPQGGLEFDTAYCDVLQMHFYESCPYLKFAHFTANQLILGSFNSTSKNRVHVIDFGLKQGMQWPALMQALALRPGGPPVFRLTAISPPQLDNSDGLQQVGWKLAQFADTLGIEFEFRGLICNSLADIEPVLFNIGRPEIETAAVNSVLELHRFLAHPSSIEKVLCLIKAMRPKIVTIVEQEGNHNGPVFVERFNEALNYYSNLFDSLEVVGPPNQDVLMSEVYLGRQICNVVACEGVDRVERHETLAQWQVRLGSAGFDPVHIGSNGFKQASTLLALFAGREGYGVEERNGCLMLTWHTRPLIAMSAWQPGGCGGDGETQ